MTQSETARVQAYMRRLFGNRNINLVARDQKDDSVEVMLGDEFIGVIFKDDEDEDTSYAFNMAILEMDLPPIAEV